MPASQMLQWGSLVVQIVFLLVGVLALVTYSSQAKATWESNVSAVYRFVFELLDRKDVRDARHLVYRLNPKLNDIVYWSGSDVPPPTREAADLVARKFDQLGLLVREGVIPLNIVAHFYASPALRCWYRLQPFVGAERKKEERKQPGHLWEWENLVFRILIPNLNAGKGIWKGVSKHDLLERYCTDVLQQQKDQVIESDEHHDPGNNFWVLRPRYKFWVSRKRPW